MDWKPIGTAPRDGTPILIAGGTYSYSEDTFPCDYPQTTVSIAEWRDRDGWHGGYGVEFEGSYWHKPTHWMPLPAPPET